MKTRISQGRRECFLTILILSLLTSAATAATVTGNIYDITGQTLKISPLFKPLATPVPWNTNGIVLDVARSARSTNGAFSIYLVGGFYSADWQGYATPVKILVPPNDTNVYTFNYCAQLATNVMFNWSIDVGTISSKVRRGSGLTIVTNNAGQPNEYLTLTATGGGGGGGYATVAGANVTVNTNDIDATYTVNADVGHQEVIDATNGLWTAAAAQLALKLAISSVGTAAYSNSTSFAGATHTHAESDVTGLVADLSQRVSTNDTRGLNLTNSANAIAGSNIKSYSALYVDTAKMTDVGNGKLAAETGFQGDVSATTGYYVSNLVSGGQVPIGSLSTGVVSFSGPFLSTNNAGGRGYSYNGSALTNLASANLTGTVPAAQMPALTGDITTSAGEVATTLKNTGTAGTYRRVTFDAQGRETSGSNPTTFSGYAISDTSANLAAALTDESGSGVVPFFSLTSLTAGQMVAWSGTGWTNGPAPSGGGGGVAIDFESTQLVTNTTGTKLTIKSAALVTNMVNSGIVSLTDAATVATDSTLGTTFKVTLGGNRTLGNPTTPRDGQRYTWEVIQDATGNRTLAFDTKFAFGTEITGVTLTTNASKRDFITAVYDSTADKFYVVGAVRGY